MDELKQQMKSDKCRNFEIVYKTYIYQTLTKDEPRIVTLLKLCKYFGQKLYIKLML
jgi:hypothetical protein